MNKKVSKSVWSEVSLSSSVSFFYCNLSLSIGHLVVGLETSLKGFKVLMKDFFYKKKFFLVLKNFGKFQIEDFIFLNIISLKFFYLKLLKTLGSLLICLRFQIQKFLIHPINLQYF